MKINETTRPQTAPLRNLPAGDAPMPEKTAPVGDHLSPGLASSENQKASGLAEEARNALLRSGDAILRKPDAANGLHNEARLEQAIEADASRESEKLEKLPAAQREEYRSLMKRVEDDLSQVRALQKLLVDGKYDEKLSTELTELSRQPLADGLDSATLVGHLLEELADPSCINQKNKNTCGAATAQILLAKQDPAEYTRLVAGLASPEGKVTLKNGDLLVREPGTEQPDDSKRTQSSRLLQPAFMEYANGGDDYDNAKDVSETHSAKAPYTGLYAPQLDKLLEASTGAKFDTTLVKEDPSDAMKKLTAAIEKGKIVPSLFNYPDVGGHFVNVTGVTKEKVAFINPWGREEDMERKTFEDNLWAVSVPQEATRRPFFSLPSLSELKRSLGEVWHHWFK